MLTFKPEMIEPLLQKYPDLIIALRAGVVSLKMTRELLDIDRYLMNDLYKTLMKAGAVVGVSSSCFRATPAMSEYLKSRGESNDNNDSA